MKFVFLSPDLRGGGAERVVVTLAGGLASRGHDVTLLLLQDTRAYSIPEGIRSIPILPPGTRLSGSWIKRVQLAWRLRQRFRALIKENGRPHLVVASLPYAWDVANIAGLNEVAFHVHNNLTGSMRHLAPIQAKRRLRHLRRLLAGRDLIAVSQGVADDLTMTFEVPSHRMRVIYNPFDLQAIRAAAAKPIDDLAGPFLLFAARNNAQKRIDRMLDAFALLGNEAPDLVMLTPPSDGLSNMIEARGLSTQVRVLGFKSNPYAYMAKAEAVILSSDHEGFGNVLVEGLICGTRVVSTDCPSGPREIMTGELAAGLAPLGDAAGLAAAIRRVLATARPEERGDLDRFSLARALDQFEQMALTKIDEIL